MQRDINKFQKAVKKAPLKPAIILEKVIEILNGYPLINLEEEHAFENKLIKIQGAHPEIIISESFRK